MSRETGSGVEVAVVEIAGEPYVPVPPTIETEPGDSVERAV